MAGHAALASPHALPEKSPGMRKEGSWKYICMKAFHIVVNMSQLLELEKEELSHMFEEQVTELRLHEHLVLAEHDCTDIHRHGYCLGHIVHER